MRVLNAPIFSASEVFSACISNIQDSLIKANYESISAQINSSEIVYNSLASRLQLYTILAHDTVGSVSASDLINLYKNKLARKSQPGRIYYDQIYNSPNNGRCPYCAQRDVSTLDHYLPKSQYPIYAVLPLNLVPACSECNKIKSGNAVRCANEQIIHPYYDDISTDRWLYAKIIEDSTVSANFFVSPPLHWDGILKERVEYHFNCLKLNKLYTSHAGDELSLLHYKFKNHKSEKRVREDLHETFTAYSMMYTNSWQTALYDALLHSNWYCSGGFNSL